MHTIIAPLGSGMNHLRWLLLLSTEYDSMSIMPNNLTEKTIFIKLNVYRKDRNCFNWIRYESIHRYLLNNIIQVHHNLKLIPNKSSKFLVINAEPNDCLKMYAKLNPLLNGLTKEMFLQETSEINQTNSSIKDSEKVLYINFKDIYKPMLDKILYDEICDFLNITNVYKEANEIHQLWYNLHIKAEEKVKNFLQIMKPMEFPWLEAPRPVNGFNSSTKEQWESMIHLLKELYGETNA